MAVPRSELVTYALCAAAIGTGVYAYGIDRGTPTTREQGARAGMLVRVWRPDDVTRVTIQRGAERIEIVREGDQWKIISPRTARADFIAVTGLLNGIGGARAERAVGVAQAADRKAFGLETPRATIEIAMKGVTLKLVLGAPAVQPGGVEDAAFGSAYLEVAPYGDDKGGVFVVGPEMARALDRGADAYRETSLLGSHPSNTFARLTVKAREPGAGVSLERSAHGSWRIPGGPRADADVVNGLFAAFADLKADPFLDDATPVDEAAGGSIDIDLKDGGKVALAFGGACPVTKKGTVVQLRAPMKVTGCVPTLVTDRLKRAGASYVDQHVFGLLFGTDNAKISEIEGVVVERDGKKLLDAERRADGLHVRSPNDEQIAKETSDEFLRGLANKRGELVTLDKPPAFVGKVTLRRRVDPLTLGTSDAGADLWDQVVEVSAPIEEGTPKAKVVYLRRVDDGALLRLAAEDAASLGEGAARDLRSPNLVDIPSDAIVKVSTRGTLPGLIPFVLQRKGGFLELTSPPLGADPSAASELLLRLSQLACTRWVADKDDGTFGLGTPSVVIEPERDPKKKGGDAGTAPTSFTIELGSETADGGVHARVKGRDPICVLAETRRDGVLRVPIDRAMVGFDVSQTPKIVVTRGKATRILQFTEAKTWQDGAPGRTSASDALARKLADYVVGLRAEGLVHLGPAGKDEGFDKPTVLAEGFDSGTKKKTVTIGGLGKLDRATIYFVRVEGVDATYGVLREDVERLLGAL